MLQFSESGEVSGYDARAHALLGPDLQVGVSPDRLGLQAVAGWPGLSALEPGSCTVLSHGEQRIMLTRQPWHGEGSAFLVWGSALGPLASTGEHVPFMMCDRKGRIRALSEAASEYLGTDDREGVQASELLVDRRDDEQRTWYTGELERVIADVIESGEEQRGLFGVMGTRGLEAMVGAFRPCPLCTDAVCVELVPKHDGSDAELARYADHVRAVSAAKSAVVGTVGHELRSPLTAILGLTELLLLDISDSSTRSSLNRIHESALAIMRHVDEFVDFMRLQDHALTLERDSVSVVALIMEVQDRVKDHLSRSERSAQLECAIATNLDAVRIHADQRRLRMALEELVRQTCAHVGQGVVTIAAQQEGNDVIIRISDRGGNLAIYDRQYLFEPLTAAGLIRQRQIAGIAVSMHVARETVRLMGGDIELIENTDSGSTFECRLPL